MNIPNTFDLYIDNKLTQSERLHFEHKLLADPELTRQFNDYLHIHRLLDEELYSPVLNYDNDEIINNLSASQRMEIESDFIRFSDKNRTIPSISSEFYKDTFPENADNKNPQEYRNDDKELNSKEKTFRHILMKISQALPSRNKIVIPWFAVAAALAVFLLAGKIIFELYFAGGKTISPREAFSIYYKPGEDKELVALITRNAVLFNSLNDLKRTDVNSTSFLLNQRNLSGEEYELALIHLALVSMGNDEFSEAIKYFKKAYTNERSKNSGTILFYMALSHLALGEYTEAKPILYFLKSTDSYYQEQAAKILRAVKQP